MFERLYEVAKRTDADVVKSNYYTYVSEPEPKSELMDISKIIIYMIRYLIPVQSRRFFVYVRVSGRGFTVVKC